MGHNMLFQVRGPRN